MILRNYINRFKDLFGEEALDKAKNLKIPNGMMILNQLKLRLFIQFI